MAKRRLPTKGWKQGLPCRRVPVGVADPSTCSHDASFLTKQLRRRHEKTWSHLPPSPHQLHVKVKVTLVQALRLCAGRTAHRGSRGIALPFHDHGTRSGWGVSVTPRPLFTPRKDPVPIEQEAGWVPGPVWTGAENLASTGIRSPDRPARS
jgi:hypothetical protein